MSGNDRFIGQLEDYLDAFDGETPLPAHVRDAVRAQLPATRQVLPDRGARRFLTMASQLSAPARLGIAAAAVIGVVVLGGAVIGNTPGPGVGGSHVPSPSPSPSAVQSAEPSASPAGDVIVPIERGSPVPCGEDASAQTGCIAPGTYALNPTTLPAPMTVTVPEGWFHWDPGAGATGLVVDSGADAPDGSGWGLVITGVGTVRRDPCDGAAGTFDPPAVDTPEELAAAIATWPGIQATEPVPASIDGAEGVQLDVEAIEPFTACSAPVTFETPLFARIDGYPFVDGGPGHPATFRIVDVGDELLVVRWSVTPQTSPFELGQGVAPDPDRHAGEHQQELEAILASIRFVEP